MVQKNVTLIVSDLHIGDGKSGDDFVNDKGQFSAFLGAQAATPEGMAGDIELIVNGDFLEFVQVHPGAYTLNSAEYWCSEAESVEKLKWIVKGHGPVFEALRKFTESGNAVTLFPGNHDIDLHWPAVQARLRELIPSVNIETSEVTYKRYGGKLRVSHGHLFEDIDPANGFKHWRNPRLSQPKDSDPKRLEMCAGTLFVVRFVNYLEEQYPFADNLHPATALAGILAREDKWGLVVASWRLTRFAAQFPNELLSSSKQGSIDVGAQLLDAIQNDGLLRKKLAAVSSGVLGNTSETPDGIKQKLSSEDAIADFVEQLMRKPWDSWIDVFDLAKPSVMSIGSSGATLSIVSAGKVDLPAACREIAKGQWNDGAQIFVLGHTHLPETEKKNGKVYYNPGSWTRYVKDLSDLTLNRLKDEKQFPYELNCVKVKENGSSLQSEMICIDAWRLA